MKRCVAFFLTLVLCLQSLFGTGVPQAVALQAQQDAAWRQMVDKLASANAAQSTESGSGSAAKPGAAGASSDASAPAQNGDAASSGSANQSSDAAPAASTAAAQHDPQPRSWDGATDNLVLSDAFLSFDGTLAEQAKTLTDEQRASGNLPSQLKATLDVSAAFNPAASTGRDGSHAHDVLAAGDSFTVALPSKIMADLQAAALRHDGSALKLDAFQLDTQGKPTSVKIAEAVVTPGALNVKVVAPVDTATGKAAAMPGQLHVRFQVPVLVDAALAGEKASQLTWALQVVPNGRPRESKLAIPAKADLLKALGIEEKVPEQADQPANSSDAAVSGSAGAAQPTSDAGSAGAARPTDDRAASAGVARPTSDASTSAGAAQPTADVPAQPVAAETPATVIRPGNRDGAPGVNGSDAAYATFTTLWADNNDDDRPSADKLTKDNEYQLTFSLQDDAKKYPLTESDGVTVTKVATEKLGITQEYFDKYISRDDHGPVIVKQTGTNTYTASVDPVLPSGAWTYKQRSNPDGSLMWEKNKDGSDKLDANGKKIPVYEDTATEQKQISWYIDHVKQGDDYKSRYETADAKTYPNYVTANQKECLQLLKDVTYTVIAKLGNDAGDTLRTDLHKQDAELKWASNQTLTVEKATGGAADQDWVKGKTEKLEDLVRSGKLTITSADGQTATYKATWPAYHPDGTPFMYSLTQNETRKEYTEDYSKYLPADALIKSMTFYDYKQVWYNNSESPDHGSETGKLYEGGTMTVTNAGTTPFYGMKQWLDDDPSQRPETTYTLWRYAAKPGTTSAQAAQVTDQNGTYISLTRSAKENAAQGNAKEYISVELIAKYIGLGQFNTIQFAKYDQDGYPYIYLLRETVPDGYERLFSKNGKTVDGADNSANDGEFADHRPSYYDHNFNVVTPTDIWPGGENSTRPDSDVSSYHNNVIINRRVGTTEVTQTKTWKVGSFQDQLKDVTVTFQAERLPQADVTYDKDRVPHAKDGKTWEKVPAADGGVKTVSGWSQEKLTQSVTGTFAKYDKDGKPYVYRWVESNVEKSGKPTGFTIVDEATQTSSFTLTLKDENGVDQKLDFTGTYDAASKMIVNRYEDKTSASVDKWWGDGKGGSTQAANPYPDGSYKVPDGGIKVQLFQNDTLVAADDKDNTFTLDGKADTDAGRAITFKLGDKTYTAHARETTPWHLEFTGLPKYDAAGSKYNYTVVETGTKGFTVSNSFDPKTNATKITNTPVGTEGPLTDIRITKDWVDGGNSSARLPVKVNLFAQRDLYASDAADAQPTIKAGTQINKDPITLDDENNWYYIARLTVYYVKDASGKLLPITGVDMLAAAFRIQEVDSDDYEVLTRDQVQRRVNAGTSAYSPVLQNWTDGNPRMFPKDKNRDGKPDDGYVYEVTYGVNREKGSLEVTNRRLGLVNIEIDKTWKDGKFPGNRPASQFTIAAKDKAVTFITEGSDGRIIATIANGGGTYPLSKIGADGNTLEPLTGKDVSISKDDKGDATLTITVDPTLDHSEYEVYGLPKYDGQGFVIEYGTAENITEQAGDYVSSLTDSDEIYSSWWHFSDELNYSYENKRTGTKDVTFHTIWYDQYVKKVLNQRPDVYLTLYKRVLDADGNPVDENHDGNPDMEKVTGYENYQWTPQTTVKDNDGTVDDKKDGNYYQQAIIRGLPKYDDQGNEIVYYATAATNVTDDAVNNLDYQPYFVTTEQNKYDADGKDVSSEVGAASNAIVVDSAAQNQQPADPSVNARGYAARESSTFDFKISSEIKGEGTKIWSNVPGIVDEADLPDISVYLQRRLADEGYPSTYPNSTPAGWSDPSVTNVDPNKKTYSVKTYADVTDKNKAEIQDGTTVLAWTHEVVRTGDYTYTYKFTNYGDNTAINSGKGSKGSSAWSAGTADPEILPRYDQYGRRYEYRTREVIDGLIDWAAAGAAAEVPGGVNFSDLEKGASEKLYNKVYDVTHGETTSFSMANVYKPSQGKLTVKKVYPGDNRTAGDAFPDVTFHLYRYYIKGNGSKSDAQLVQTKTLAGSEVKSTDDNVTGSGTVTFDNVDIYAPNGQYWVYYVTEDKVNGYDGAAAMGDVAVDAPAGTFDIDAADGVVTSRDLATFPADGGNPNGTAVRNDNDVDVTFKNTYKPDTLKLTGGNKQWGDHGDAFGTRPSIEDFQKLITLKRVGSKQKNETVTFNKYIQQHKADNPNDPNDKYDKGPDADPLTDPNLFVWRQYGPTDDNWYFEILNLERWAPDGTPWKYTITEDGKNSTLTDPGYSNSNNGYDKGTSGDTTTGSADIAGSWFNDLRGRVSVTKAWKGANELLLPASVTVQLQARKKASNDAWHKAGEYWKSLVTDAEKKAKISETSPISTEMVLTAQNNWTDSREKLPVKINGTEIEYRVVETKIDGIPVKPNDDGTYANAPGDNKTGKDFVYSYATEGKNESKQAEGQTDGFTEGWDKTDATVTNTLQSTSLTVKKTWQDEDNAWGTRPSVTFKLQRKVGSGAWAWVVPTGTADASETNALSVTIEPGAAPAEATFKGLPKYDRDGATYAYRAVEIVPTGYTLEGGVAVDDSTDAQAAAQDGTSFTNKLDTVGLTGTKTWKVNGNTSAIPNALDLTLTRKVAGGTYEDVALGALKDTVAFKWTKSDDNLTWTYTISGLPKYDPSGKGKTYIYNVRETVPVGFSSSVAQDDTTVDDTTGNQTAPTITNTLKTGSVSLTKVDSRDESKKLNGAVFTLQKQEADGKTWSDWVTGLVTGKSYEMNDTGDALKDAQGSDGQTGVLSISGLALGTYRFVETEAPAGYQFDAKNPATSDEFTITTANSGTPQTLKNVSNTSNSFTLDKVGTDPQDGVGTVSLNSVTIELVKDSKTYARWTRGEGGKVSATVWSDGDSNKAGVPSSDGSITGLPAGTYQVKETEVPGDYVKTSVMGTLTLDVAGKVTVTPSNGLPKGASLTVDETGVKVTLTDPVVKGSLKLTKTLGSEQSAPALKDAKFDLYRVGAGVNGADEKIATGLVTDKDGVIDTSKSDVAMTGSVAAYGRTKLSDGLLPGTYYFRETATTSGAVLPEGDAAKSARLVIPANGGDAGTLAPAESVTMANTPFSASAQLTKVEAGPQATPINGAVFKLEYQAPGSAEYATVSASLQSGNTYGLQWNADGTLLPSQTTTKTTDGLLQFTNLKKGSYRLTETSNAGYDLPDASLNQITFAVVDANNGKPILLGQNGQTAGQLANTRKLGSASLKKTGKDGVALDGVTFKLQVKQGDSWTDTGLGELATGKSYDAGGELDAQASGARANSGTLSVKGLPWGTYRFVETKALPGYSTKDDAGNDIKSSEFTINRTSVEATQELGTINNTYTPTPATVALQVTKALSGRDWRDGDSFTFELKAAGTGNPEGAVLPKKTTVNVTAASAGHTAAFDKITFSKPGTFKFQISEQKGTVGGIGYDGSVKTVTVAVRDDVASGKLTVDSVNYGDDAKATSASFANTYTPGTASVRLRANKTLNGAAPAAGRFSFELRASDEAGTSGKLLQTKRNDGSGAVNFDAIDGLAPGAYHYVIREVDDHQGGVAYDGRQVKATVTVTDDGAGRATAAVTYDGSTDAPTFANTYTPAAASDSFVFRKSLIGRDLRAGEFSFELTGLNGAPMPKGANGDKTTVQNAADGSVSFGSISYDRAGTYEYTVHEAAGSLGGVKYDSGTYDVTVTVSDDSKGVLHASHEIKRDGKLVDEKDAVFKNTYAPAPTTAALRVSKALIGRDWRDGDAFTFELKADPKNPEGAALPDPATAVVTGKSADHAASFGDITFSKAGTFKFQISEQAGNAGGMDYDETEKTATVTVTDDGQGALHAVVTYDGAVRVPTFTNTYTPGTASVRLQAAKTLNGQVPAEGRFSFDLYAADADGNVASGAKPLQTKANAADGSVAFDEISGLRSGAYHYVIREVDDHQGGVAYDGRQVKVTVTVTDDGAGKATAAVTYDGSADAPTFVNAYKPNPAADSFSFRKVLTGRDLRAGEFSFELTGLNGAPMPAGAAEETATVKNGADGTVSFGPISYDRAGTYEYTVREVGGGVSGVVYDSASYDVTVTVKDDGKGALSAFHSITRDGKAVNDEAPTFKNTYKPGSTSASLEATKELAGAELKAGEFSFQVKEGDKVVAETANAADGKVSFPAISYAEAGEHDYAISEVKGSADGVTYDPASYKAHVSVTDDGAGALSAKVTYDGGSSAPVFKNAYDASGSIGVAGSKAVTGSDGSDITSDFAGKFTFALTGVDGAPVRVADKDGRLEEKESLTADNDAKGSVSLGELHFSLSDLAGVKTEADGSRSKTFAYQVAESGTAAGVTNDKVSTKTFKVTVTDDGSGKLKVTSDPGDSTKLFAFTNSYDATGSLSLTGAKTMTGRALTSADAYTFNVYEGNRAAGVPVSTGTSDASGKITFDKPLTYTLKDVGTHTYTVAEDTSSLPGGVSAVTKTRAFTVDVSDEDHNGTLRVAATDLGDGNSVDFENAYHPTAATDSFSFKKVLSGRDLKEGEFSFELVGADGAPMPDGAKDGKATVQNAADGSVFFGSITYDSAGAYTYTVKEVPGSLGGITYDSGVYDVTVTVKDDGAGALHASHAITRGGKPVTDKDAVFANTYQPSATSAELHAQKNLTGRDWQQGDVFAFRLEAVGGTLPDGTTSIDKADVPMPEGAKDGAIEHEATDGNAFGFGSMSFTTTGTYLYNIREVAPTSPAPGMSYSTDTYRATVTVTDDGKGKLSSSVKMEKLPAGDAAKAVEVKATGDPVATFTNTYNQLSQSWAPTVMKNYSDPSGANPMTAGKFTFQLKALDGAPLPATAKDGAVVATNTEGGTATFPAITFTDKNLGANGSATTYRYEISEVAGTERGMTYDSTVYVADVTVSLDNGVLKVSPVITKKGSAEAVAQPTFSNAYAPTATDVQLKAHKTLSGATLKEGQFSFSLYEGAVSPADGAKLLDTRANDARGDVAFKELAFDRPGTYAYTIAEVVPADAQDGVKDGVKYDNAWRHVTVDVALDKASGRLEAQVKGDVDASGSVQFTNSYTPGTAEVQLRANKTLNGQAPVDGRFRFELYEADADGKVAEGAKPLQTKANAADGSVTFDKLTDLAVGEHHYVIREVDDHQGGVAYDGRTVKVTVAVTDDGDGTATAAATYDGKADTPTFKNAYDASGSIGIAGTKKVTGSDGSDLTSDFAGRFTFTLTGVDGAPVRVAGEGGKLEDKKSLTATNAADGSVSLGELQYKYSDVADAKPEKDGSRSKTFTYQVEESGTAAGVTNDATATKSFTVKVTDDGSGKLKVASNQTDPVKLFGFTNTYTPAPATAALRVSKALIGREWRDGDEFTFMLAADKGNRAGAVLPNPATAVVSKESADHAASFGDITFNKPGTFKFHITEQKGSAGGIDYDGSSKTATVTVRDDVQSGTLVVDSVKYGNDANAASASFTNTYKTTGTSDSFSFKKILTGRALKAGEFSFELTGLDGAPMPEGAQDGKATVKNAADGAVSFGSIAYDKVGTYEYAVREVAGGVIGVAYDPSTYNVTVTVTDDGQGTLHASHAITRDGKPVADGDAVFTNSYKPGVASVQLRAAKTLNGQTPADGRFRFELYEADADGGVPEGAKPLQTKANGADGTVTFDEISNLAPGVHYYAIREVDDGQGGVTYDGRQVKVAVTVTDDGAGKATAAVTYDGAPEVPTFANTYKPSSATDAFSFKKVLTGRDLGAGEFSFELTGLDGAPMPEGSGDGKLTVKNAADGSVAFGPIAYDRAGAYTYTVREAAGNVSGVSYDSAAYTVTVTVTDDLKGALHASHSITRDGKAVADKDAVFKNTYAPGSTSVSLTASKALSGRQLKDGEFTFQVREGGRVVAEAVNAVDGTVAFPAIAYDAPGEHDYTISEVKGSEPGVAYDGASHKAHVSVTDSGDGTLKAIATYEGGDAPNFTNTYAPGTAEAQLGATKTLNGQAPAEGRFSFELYASDADSRVAEGAKPLRTAKNAADGTVSFAKLTGLAPGDHYYVIREVDDHQAGVGYDGRQVRVTVTVVDDGAGKVSATVAYDGKPETPTFANTYKPSSATDAFSFKKVLTGRDLGAGEFSFELTGVDGAPMPEGAKDGKLTVKNAADGSVSFGGISYDKAGTYTYSVREVPGSVSGVAYDSAAYTVTVTVTDGGAGALHAGHVITLDGKSVADGDAVFNNSYKPGSASVALTASKTLTGRDLRAGEFSFQVREGGRVVAEAVNGADGKISFPVISYTEAGEHDYAISEVKGSEPGVAYDGSVHKVHVSVTDNGDGTLRAAVTYDGGKAPTFTNTYNPIAQTWAPTVRKSYSDPSGANPMTAGKFTFRLKALGGAPLPDAAKGDAVDVTNTEVGTATFPAITFTDKDLGANGSARTYRYEISEVAGTERGMTYDPAVYVADVTVSLDNGVLKVSPVITKKGGAEAVAQPTFSNAYAPAATDVQLKAHKTLSGAALANGQFSFSLYEGTVSSADGAKPIDTRANDARGDVAFRELAFDKPGSYSYTIAEAVPADAQGGVKGGVKYDTAWKHVTVEVTLDKASGKLKAQVTGDVDDSGSVRFSNSYAPAPAYIAIPVQKVISGRDWTDSDSFSFQLSQDPSDPVGAALPAFERVTVDAKAAGHRASFAPISFSKAGTYRFQVRELGASHDGLAYDRSVKTVTVTVADDGSGALHATFAEGSATPIFTNFYVPESHQIRIHKVDEDGNPLSGAGFTVEGAFADGTSSKTVTTDDSGFARVAMIVAGGEYRIRETTAPVGFEGVDGALAFSVSIDGSIQLGGGAPEGFALDGSDAIRVVNRKTALPPSIPPRIARVLPQTGDPVSTFGLYAITALGMASLAGGLRGLRRRMEER